MFILVTWLLIGFSGAVMPGSLLAVVIKETSENGWRGGELAIFGHFLLEGTALVVIFSFYQGVLSTIDLLTESILLLGGLALVIFGLWAVKDSRNVESITLQENIILKDNNPFPINSIVVGIVATGANAYWWVWWVTVGVDYVGYLSPYLPENILFLGTSLLIILLIHIISDLSWYTAIIFSLTKAQRFLDEKTHQYLILSAGLFLILIGIMFLYDWVVVTGLIA